MVFSPLIPRRTDLTKEHIIGEKVDLVKNSLNTSADRKKNNTNSWCGQRDIWEICHNNAIKMKLYRWKWYWDFYSVHAQLHNIENIKKGKGIRWYDQTHVWGGANFRNSLVLLYFTSSFETNWTKAQKNMNNAMISFENKQYVVAMPLLLSMYTTKLSVWSNIWEICQHKKTHRNMQKRKWLLDGGGTSFWSY